VQVPVKGIQHSGVNVVYGTTLKVGGEDITVTLDTGSSDTWLVSTGFKCLSKTTKREVAAKRCKFGPTYNKSKTFSQVTGQYFQTGYADQTFVTGVMAKETVSLGNVTIKNQLIGFVNRAAWEGDGVSSGLMGLAYPSITSAWAGTGPLEGNKKGANIPYTPIFTAMHRQKLIAPYFSLALNRPKESPGVIALGGLPGAPIRYNSTFARAPLQHLTISPKASSKGEDGFEDYKFYIVNADGFTVGSSSVNTKAEVIIDSGSPLTYLPPEIAAAIHAKWTPPLKQDRLTKQYLYTCGSSRPPKIGVTFGGKTVHFDNADLSIVASGNLCLSGIQPAQGKGMRAVSILGGSFLKGVVAVFDVGAAEMRFANRIR
jgi:hypothetical protein